MADIHRPEPIRVGASVGQGPRRRRSTTIAAAGLSLLLGLAACSAGDDSNAGSATDSASQADSASLARLLAPASFAAYVEGNPRAPVVNVHIPYEGHIEGTDAFVPFEEIGSWADLPEDRSAPIVLYCLTGRMSAIATTTLTEMGYTDIIDLEGGMKAWTEADFVLLDDPPADVDTSR